jgi:hypothetical protein
LVEEVYRLDDGAVVEDFCHCLDQVGVKALRAEVRGAARHREMLPVVP